MNCLTKALDNVGKRLEMAADGYDFKDILGPNVSKYDIYIDRNGDLFALRKGAPLSAAEWLGNIADFDN